MYSAMRRCEPARCRSLIARRAFSTASRPSLHVLLYSYVNDVLTLRQPYRALHLEKAQQSAARGELLLGGALSDPVDGALLVFAGGHNVAERFADCDPYVQHGIVQSWTVREWSAVAGAILPPQPLLFSPSYDWQPVEPNAQMLPAGLEVELPLDGQRGRARITTTSSRWSCLETRVLENLVCLYEWLNINKVHHHPHQSAITHTSVSGLTIVC